MSDPEEDFVSVFDPPPIIKKKRLRTVSHHMLERTAEERLYRLEHAQMLIRTRGGSTDVDVSRARQLLSDFHVNEFTPLHVRSVVRGPWVWRVAKG